MLDVPVVVAGQPDSLAFKERRAVATTRAIVGVGHYRGHDDRIVAVDDEAGIP